MWVRGDFRRDRQHGPRWRIVDQSVGISPKLDAAGVATRDGPCCTLSLGKGSQRTELAQVDLTLLVCGCRNDGTGGFG